MNGYLYKDIKDGLYLSKQCNDLMAKEFGEGKTVHRDRSQGTVLISRETYTRFYLEILSHVFSASSSTEFDYKVLNDIHIERLSDKSVSLKTGLMKYKIHILRSTAIVYYKTD